jgi:hypothetical protein
MNSKILICTKTTLPLAMLAFFCGCHKQEETPATPTPAASKPAIISAEKTSFDEVTAKLDRGGNLYVYLSTEQALSGLSAKMESISNFIGNLPGVPGAQTATIGKIFDFANAWLKDSGIEQISGVGMSSIAREPGFYYSKMVVHHYPGQNAGEIWTLMGKGPHPLKELDLLPEDTVMATFSDLDLPLAWTNLQKHLKQLDISAVTDGLEKWPEQFRKLTELDFDKVLDSLGGNYGMILTLDAEKKVSLPIPGAPMEIPSPGLAIIVKVNSDVIFDRVDALCKGNPLVVRVDNPDLKMRTVTVPIPLPVELRPSIARSGDYLLLATTDTMIQDMLAVKAGKKKGFKSTAEFARLSQGIPEQGNNLSLVADRFVRAMMQIQQQALTNNGTMSPAQVSTLQHAFNNGTNYSAYSVGVNDSEGWVGYANGSQTLQSAILPMVAGIGVAAALAIPAIAKAHQSTQNDTPIQPGNITPDRETVRYNNILKNLRLLQTAKLKWAGEKGKHKGDTVTLQDLASYLDKGPIKPVADEEYNPQPIGAQPTARLAHELDGHIAGSDITAPAAKKKEPAAT